jgi:hydroxymethylglutaryl-CoA synthase
MPQVGIDDIAIYVPRLYFAMQDFVKLRGADFEKLSQGLGLSAMAIPDVHEDAATMGANAVAQLIDSNSIDPRTIGRIYLGTESALDGAKPTATYIMDMLQQKYADDYGPGSLSHCDAVDLTFACIGAVDALHNMLDWVVRGGAEEDRVGIVAFADHAKYDLGSSGEYTQGAGGGAILIKHNPRLLAIADIWGVATTPVHDFFKPRREIPVRSMLESVFELLEQSGETVTKGLVDKILSALPASDNSTAQLFANETITLHSDTPVFDGQFSNRCYAEAVKSAFADFTKKAVRSGRFDPESDKPLTDQWSRLVVHLPYAFQGKRMLPDVFQFDRSHLPDWQAVVADIGSAPVAEHYEDSPDGREDFAKAKDQYRRLLANTPQFRAFVERKLEKSQRASSLVGNQYTGSIFLALVSVLESDYREQVDLRGQTLGFCGYGSGAKAKVFEGEVQDYWQQVTGKFSLFERLADRHAIDAAAYESLHRGVRKKSLLRPRKEFVLLSVGVGRGLEGQRSYAWVDE